MVSVVKMPSKRPKLACGDYDVDAFVIELDETTLDFRFELGMGLSIFWALPAADGDRLRLIHVDGAAYWVDEPTVWTDPFVFDLPRTGWRGELGALHDGSMVIAVSIESTAEPARYRCEVVRRLATGDEVTRVFAWERPATRPARPATRRTAADVAATTALVDGIIDAYHRWDDPDRVEARAAREAEQERRTIAILTHGSTEPLDAIVAAPDDDAPRLAWATAVGGPRGELVRVQCELARGGLSLIETVARKRRVRELLDTYGASWSGVEGVATEVRFERGFVDAARVTAETWLAHGARIRERAPLVAALTIGGLHAQEYGGGEGTAHVLGIVDRVLADPNIRGIPALDLASASVEVIDDDDDWTQTLAPAVAQRLTASGLVPALRGLSLGDVGADGLRALGGCDVSRLEVLHIGAWGKSAHAWLPLFAPGRLPALRALAIHGTNSPRFAFETLFDAVPALVDLAFSPVSTVQLTMLASHPLARQLERLAFGDGSLGNTHLLAEFPRLRSLDVHDTFGILVSELTAATLPALRELRYFQSSAGMTVDVIRSVVDRFGAQLELLDLRGCNRYEVFGSDAAFARAAAAWRGDVAGDLVLTDGDPPRLGLFHLGRAHGSSWWDHVALA